MPKTSTTIRHHHLVPTEVLTAVMGQAQEFREDWNDLRPNDPVSYGSKLWAVHIHWTDGGNVVANIEPREPTNAQD